MDIQKALVVDDSKVAHLTLRKLLTERGIQVDWVGSGEDAIAYMEKQRPDIIFMDVMMPGMDGFETAHTITSNSAITAPPVIMCSANATEEDKQNAQRSGAVSFLSKPYTPAQMDQILAMVGGLSAPAAKPAPAAPQAVVPPAAKPEVPPAVKPAIGPIPASIAVPADVERIAADTAKAVAERAAREAARAAAQEMARTTAEEAGRKAAQAALEAAKKSAADIAKLSAAEAARTIAEQIARDISREAAQQAVVRGLAEGRENLTRGLEEQIVRVVRDALGQTLTGKEFKQQLQQLASEAVLPKAEASARQVATDAVQNATAQAANAAKSANLAFVIGLVAVVIALVALVKGFL